MRREAVIFVATTLVSAYLFGAISVAGLFMFGLVWMVFGKE